MSGAKEWISEKYPTIVELLKNHGNATSQFGKNHLRDLDKVFLSKTDINSLL
jgi:arylsulfatase A-like enzyme